MTNCTKMFKNRSQWLAILIAFFLPLVSYGFGTPSFNTHAINSRLSPSTNSVRSLKTSPLFVASSSDVNGTDSAVIRSLDAQMKKMQREKDKMAQKVSKYESSLQALKKKKMQYLDGSSLGKSPEGGNFSETTLRSAVKAFAWRIIAGSVTFITSLKFSGSLATALSIVGSDFFSKAFTMFVGERLMNKSQAGRKAGADSAGRSIAKALIWRLFAICNTLTVSFFFAKDLKMASKIAGSDAIFKTALMVAYERVWARIEWGKEYTIEFSI